MKNDIILKKLKQYPKSHLQECVNSLLKTLSINEREILQKRFGLTNGRVESLSEISQEFGIPVELVQKIETQALRKLRNNFHNQLSRL